MHRNHNVLYAVIVFLLLAGGYGWLRNTDSGNACGGAVANELRSLSEQAGDVKAKIAERLRALAGKKDVEQQH